MEKQEVAIRVCSGPSFLHEWRPYNYDQKSTVFVFVHKVFRSLRLCSANEDLQIFADFK
jgi:hypothetical protein